MPISKRLVVHCRVAPFDVYIGRPSIWGNPFSHLERSAAEFRVGTRTESIEAYEKWLYLPSQRELLAQVKKELRGKVLGCYCKPLSCHGDVLARIANS